jgi:hypothetical protein
MAPPSFRDLLGMPASTASTSDSALLVIDAQNEYVSFISWLSTSLVFHPMYLKIPNPSLRR